MKINKAVHIAFVSSSTEPTPPTHPMNSYSEIDLHVMNQIVFNAVQIFH